MVRLPPRFPRTYPTCPCTSPFRVDLPCTDRGDHCALVGDELELELLQLPRVLVPVLVVGLAEDHAFARRELGDLVGARPGSPRVQAEVRLVLDRVRADHRARRARENRRELGVRGVQDELDLRSEEHTSELQSLM